MKIVLHVTTKRFPVVIHCSKIQELQILCVIPVGNMVAERSLSCIRQVDNWHRNSMLTDLLGDVTIIAVQGHTIFILKADIYNAYISIKPRRMMASSLIIGN